MPTYLYVVTLAGLIVYGLFRCPSASLAPRPAARSTERYEEFSDRGPSAHRRDALRSCCGRFSSGAVALTGVEAISNGVPAFRKPEAQSAADDPRRGMGVILGTCLPRHLAARPPAPADAERGRDGPRR